MSKKIRLTKDYLIPKGTIFECIDGSKREFISGNYEAMMSITNDSTAHFIIDDDCLENNSFEYIE